MNSIDLYIEDIEAIDLYIEGIETIDLEIESELYGVGKDSQEKEVTPSEEEQVVLPDDGFLMSKVTVDAIPPNYGRIAWDGTALKVY